MENFSIPRMLPGVGATPGIGPPASSGFDIGGIPGFDVIQRLFMKLGLDPSFLGEFSTYFGNFRCNGNVH
jgi:chaperone BCS1